MLPWTSIVTKEDGADTDDHLATSRRGSNDTAAQPQHARNTISSRCRGHCRSSNNSDSFLSVFGKLQGNEIIDWDPPTAVALETNIQAMLRPRQLDRSVAGPSRTLNQPPTLPFFSLAKNKANHESANAAQDKKNFVWDIDTWNTGILTPLTKPNRQILKSPPERKLGKQRSDSLLLKAVKVRRHHLQHSYKVGRSCPTLSFSQKPPAVITTTMSTSSGISSDFPKCPRLFEASPGKANGLCRLTWAETKLTLLPIAHQETGSMHEVLSESSFGSISESSFSSKPSTPPAA